MSAVRLPLLLFGSGVFFLIESYNASNIMLGLSTLALGLFCLFEVVVVLYERRTVRAERIKQKRERSEIIVQAQAREALIASKLRQTQHQQARLQAEAKRLRDEADRLTRRRWR